MKGLPVLVIFASGCLIGAFVLWLAWEFIVDWQVSRADRHYDFPGERDPRPRPGGGPRGGQRAPVVIEDVDGGGAAADVIELRSRRRAS